MRTYGSQSIVMRYASLDGGAIDSAEHNAVAGALIDRQSRIVVGFRIADVDILMDVRLHGISADARPPVQPRGYGSNGDILVACRAVPGPHFNSARTKTSSRDVLNDDT